MDSPDHDPRAHQRRTLGKSATAMLAAALVSVPATAAARAGGGAALSLVKPARLREGDLVGLITPCGYQEPSGIDKARRNIESLGFRTRLGAHVLARRGRYAGTVAQRLEDLHAMFADPEVKAVWAITGGSGGVSLLAHIDYALIRRHPKVFVGYSDVTCLHLAIQRQARLVTFHGPVGISTFSDYTRRHLLALLTDPQPRYTMAMADENRAKAETLPAFRLRTIQHGLAEGRLSGGNLSLVAALAGTPYAPEVAGHLVFLEDIGEEPYRIDRMLVQLDLSQGLRQAAGLMLGVFEKCEAPISEGSLSLDETLDATLGDLDVPAVKGYSFGHIGHQMTLPLGIMARMDTLTHTLTLLESAVT